MIPLEDGLNLELDIFDGDLKGLVIAEIEFPDKDAALSYKPPAWLGEDVTLSPLYHNSVLSRMESPEGKDAAQ